MEREHSFASYLEGIKDDRGKLAALRRGLGLKPGTCAAMYPVVSVAIPKNCPLYEEEVYYLISSLFGYHPLSTTSGNMGDHMRHASGDKKSDAIERRFTRLLATHWEDLPNELRQSISFLKSKETPVNWHQLLSDLKHWSHPDRFVQRRWANAFWGFDLDKIKNKDD